MGYITTIKKLFTWSEILMTIDDITWWFIIGLGVLGTIMVLVGLTLKYI